MVIRTLANDLRVFAVRLLTKIVAGVKIFGDLRCGPVLITLTGIQNRDTRPKPAA
jgi:hypothetical protein